MIDDDSAVRRLLEQAGPRPELPEDDIAAIRETARGQWRRRYGVRAARAWPARWWWAVAAAALVAAIGLLQIARGPASPPAAAAGVASIEQVSGAVEWEAERGKPVEIAADAVGRTLPAASKLDTGTRSGKTGLVALRMAGGASVRLDAASRMRILSRTLVELRRGAIYVDTGAASARGEEVAVRTPAGLFEATGTQFEVRSSETGVRLRVREGTVSFGRGRESVRTEAGGELVVRGDGSLAQGSAPVSGPEWDWVLESAPMRDIEGMKVRDFLDWIARETGWRVEFADAETAALADSVVLHGSIEHLTPAQAPAVVLPSCGLGHRLSDGTLRVFADSAIPD